MSIFETYEQPVGEWEAFQGESDQEEQFLGALLGGELSTGELNEAQELELASELLEINSEEELEEFLGKLVGKAVRGISNFAKSGVGKSIIGGLKNVAKTALPMVGGALGSLVAPGVGTALGSKLGTMASKMFELELEAMDEQEAEFEVARRIVRMGASAARTAATAPRSAPPKTVAKTALVQAAKKHAPGLARATRTSARRPSSPRPGRGSSYPTPYPVPAYGGGGVYAPTYVDGSGDDDYDDDGYGGARRARAGRWVRRGRKIVIYGA